MRFGLGVPKTIRYWGDSKWSDLMVNTLNSNLECAKIVKVDHKSQISKYYPNDINLLEYPVFEREDVVWYNPHLRYFSGDMGKRCLCIILHNRRSPQRLIEYAKMHCDVPKMGYMRVSTSVNDIDFDSIDVGALLLD